MREPDDVRSRAEIDTALDKTDPIASIDEVLCVHLKKFWTGESKFGAIPKPGPTAQPSLAFFII